MGRRNLGRLVMAASAMAVLSFPSAAGAATLGELFVPTDNCSDGIMFLQTDTPSTENPYAATADGVITSWSFRAGTLPPELKFKVARPLGGPDRFRVIGESGLKTPTASSRNTYPIQIPVRAGDVIGFFLNTVGQCSRNPIGGYVEHTFAGDVPPGTAETMDPGPEFQLDIRANLVTKKCDGKTPTIGGTSGGDTLRGTPEKDVIVALAGRDTIKGLDANDRLCGNGADDKLKGRGGNDTLKGGRGDDVLRGGPGVDVCIGGPGDDEARRCEVERSI